MKKYYPAPLGFVKIKGLEKRYSINRDGVVFSHARNKIKAPANDRGYLHLTWKEKNTMHGKRIHRIVAETFIPNPKNKPEINHKDGNKSNCNVCNLEWVTREENILHAKDNFLYTPKFKSENEFKKYLISTKLKISSCDRFYYYFCKYGYEIKKEYFIENNRNFTHREQQMIILMDEFKKNIPLIASILGVGNDAIYVRIRNMGYKLYYCLYKNGILIHKIEQKFKDRGNYKS